jgi:hypothetical protein
LSTVIFPGLLDFVFIIGVHVDGQGGEKSGEEDGVVVVEEMSLLI